MIEIQSFSHIEQWLNNENRLLEQIQILMLTRSPNLAER